MPRMDLNLHGMDRSLVQRAKSRAAALGLTLKQWIIGLMEKALKEDQIDSRATLDPRSADRPDLASQRSSAPNPEMPRGRRDLLPPGGGPHE